jgi:hypothetical protein
MEDDAAPGTRRARQLSTVGGDMLAGLMPEELLEAARDALADWAHMYEFTHGDLGEGVRRRLVVTGMEDDCLEIEVRWTREREHGPRFRLTLKIQEIN